MPVHKQPFTGLPIRKAPLPEKVDNQYIKFFSFYGCFLTKRNQQLQGDCPFPDCENPADHFYANPGTGQWDCKRCGRKGNTYQFLAEFHKACLEQTTHEHYMTLCAVRPGISVSTFEEFGLAWSETLGEWLLPAYSLEQRTLTNLYVWRKLPDSDKMAVMSGPTLKQTLFGLQFFQQKRGIPLFVCEGQWDLMAFHELTGSIENGDGTAIRTHYNLVGVPGANTFPKDYLTLLEAADIRLLYDNDQAGREGINGVIRSMGQNGITPLRVGSLVWPPSTKDKYDIRDLIAEAAIHDTPDETIDLEAAVEVFNYIQSNLKPKKLDLPKESSEGYDPNIKPSECNSFDELITNWRLDLNIPDVLADVGAFILAVNASTELADDPLWGYLIGPPGSGKSTLTSLVSPAHPYCFALDKFTGFLSGFRGATNSSLITKVNKKTLIINDFTSVLTMQPGTKDTIFGELRFLYDGKAEAHYRNAVKQSFGNIRFTLLACTTDVIRTENHTELGERFLQIEMDSLWSEEGELSRYPLLDTLNQAVSNILSRICDVDKPRFLAQKSQTWGFMDVLHKRASNREYVLKIAVELTHNTKFRKYLTDMAQWVGMSRSTVERNRSQQMMYRSRPELGSRLSTQLTKLALSLCIVFDTTDITEDIIRIIRKVALDTAMSFQLEMMLVLARHGRQDNGLTREEIKKHMPEISLTSIDNFLNDMRVLGIIRTEIERDGRIGRPRNVHYLSNPTVQLALSLGFRKAEDDD